MRLRALSEAECYTRCYGGRPGERPTVVRILSPAEHRPQRKREAQTERGEKAAA